MPAPNTKPTRIYVKSVADIPNRKHWAIITDDVVVTTGYDPGDPPGRENVTRYVAYTDQAEWETAVKELALSKRTDPYQAIVVDVPTITVTAEVSIK